MSAKYTDERRAEAFWKRVDKSGGPNSCWPWLGCKSKQGYGHVGRGKSGHIILAHRYALILNDGINDPPPHIFALHACDNPRCCNPKHLRWGSAADNTADCIARKRHPTITFSEDQRLTIKRRYAAGERQVALAKEYGVSQAAISYVVRHGAGAVIKLDGHGCARNRATATQSQWNTNWKLTGITLLA